MQQELQSSIDTALEKYTEVNDEGIYTLQSAGVCMDNQTGYVKAIVGGRSQEYNGYTIKRAYKSFRQPGSAIKPLLVYTPVLERSAEILKKLVANKYLALNKKTQIITPTLLGEMIYDVVNASIRPLLNPDLTASWEKGLTYVAEGSITTEEYMVKLENFIKRRTDYNICKCKQIL